MRRLIDSYCPPLAVVALVATIATIGSAPAEERGVESCFSDLASCPITGCAPAGSTEALINKLKRTLPPSGTPIRMTLDDFLELQNQATRLVKQKHPLDEEARRKLRDLKLKSSNQKISEGELVELAGFMVGLPDFPKASGPESVNCRLSGTVNSDFHIPIAAEPGDTEFEGIVVEMIPQNRSSEWTIKKLKRIAKEGRPVVIRGQLFYDNMHLVNEDPHDVLHGQPKRASLWEIHPVTEFFVCMTANKKCNPKNVKTQQWMRLEKIKEQ